MSTSPCCDAPLTREQLYNRHCSNKDTLSLLRAIVDRQGLQSRPPKQWHVVAHLRVLSCQGIGQCRERESVVYWYSIFSILYTSMYSPAGAASLLVRYTTGQHHNSFSQALSRRERKREEERGRERELAFCGSGRGQGVDLWMGQGRLD